MIIGPHAFGFLHRPSTDLSAYAQAVLNDNPVGYWQLNEESGTTATDSSGNGNDGTYENVTQGVSPLIASNKAAEFSPSNNSNIETNWDGITGQSAFTVEAWVKTSANNEGTWVSWGNWDVGGGKLHCRIDNGSPRMEISNGAIVWDSSINDGITHHVVMTHPGGGAEANEAKCWVDGLEKSISDGSTTSIDLVADDPVTIGKNADAILFDDRFFDGVIDELAIYDRALTSTEIQEHYDAGVGN